MKLFTQQYGEKDPAVIILHGMLGSGRNWHSIAKILAEKNRILVPDLRNHGRSPHSATHEINGLVDDVLELQRREQAAPGVLMGHSMGGLIAFESAFRSPNTVKALIVIDVAPRGHSGNVVQVIEAMRKIDLTECGTKDDVNDLLSNTVTDPLVRQFVMTNLQQEQGFRWRVNLPALYDYLEDIRTYQPAATDYYEGPALFLRGDRSDYIVESDRERIMRHFPLAKIKTVANAGHWVHYDNPTALLNEIQIFLQSVM